MHLMPCVYQEKESKKKDKGSKISIVLSTIQTLVLLLFNEQVPGQKVALTLNDISNSIKVSTITDHNCNSV